MAQYDDDEHALQVSMRGREHHHFRILSHLPEATGISCGYRQPLCGMPEHVLIHQIRQCCALPLTVDDPFLQLFF